jgi:hypothetical protein
MSTRATVSVRFRERQLREVIRSLTISIDAIEALPPVYADRRTLRATRTALERCRRGLRNLERRA